MKKDSTIFLRHIKENIALIESQIKTKEIFMTDKNMQDATLRRLEIIGEAVKNLPDSFRNKHPAIPWKPIAGFRDKLIHHYFGVDMEKVWKVLSDDLPKIKKTIDGILEEL